MYRCCTDDILLFLDYNTGGHGDQQTILLISLFNTVNCVFLTVF